MSDSDVKTLLTARQYQGVQQIVGPLLFVDGIHDVGYNELVEIIGPDGEERLGTVLETREGAAVVQVFEGTTGLSLPDTVVRFRGEPLKLPVSKEMLGRVFDGLGRPIDGEPNPYAEDAWNVNGAPVNPTARTYPTKFIQTGISAIDGMNTLVRGQKLPVFSGSGLPHNRVASQIVRQAKIVDRKSVV